jgi:hypothetical protein
MRAADRRGVATPVRVVLPVGRVARHVEAGVSVGLRGR